MNRQLSVEERQLVHWMLEQGTAEAKAFLPQLEKAHVTPWRCGCGCASFNLAISDLPEPSGGIHPIAESVFGTGKDLNGIFIYEQNGVLAGVEVYGMTGDASKVLPSPTDLRTFDKAL